MAKEKTVYKCSECGHSHLKWKSQCAKCGTLGTLEESEEIVGSGNVEKQLNSRDTSFTSMSDMEVNENERFDLGYDELNELMGGGLYKGSATIFTGEPGNGKSTLFLQLSANFVDDVKVAYFSGEESEQQVLSRAIRLGVKEKIEHNFILKFTGSVEEIMSISKVEKPGVIFIDSIQTLFSDNVEGKAGNKSQIDYCIDELVRYCKTNKITLLLAGQVNKSGYMAGPKTLEHAVDSVIYIRKEEFDGKELRFFKSEKNRFGSTEALVSAEMTESGLRIISQEEAAELFFKESNIQDTDYGYIFSMVFEGRTPFIVEVQCAISQVAAGFPFRRAIGYNEDRLNQVLMVLEKFGELLSGTNVAVNVSGKYDSRNSESLDLAVAMAILSAKNKLPFGKVLAYGEMGLRGEIKGVKYKSIIEKQAKKSGFKEIYSKEEFNHIKLIIDKLGL